MNKIGIPILILLLILSVPLHAQYCNPLHRDQYVEPILDGVSLGAISNMNNGYPQIITGYSDYTSQSTDLVIGSTYSMTVKLGAAFQYNFAAWIDYNHDHEFEPDEKIGNTIILDGYATGIISFIVPLTAYNGITRLRVRAVHEPFGPWDHSTDPCAPWEEGEAEDYSVNISGGLDNNISLKNLISPVSGVTMGNQLAVTIQNTGNTSASDFSVNYSINNGTIVSEIFNDSIPPDSISQFIFTTPYDFSQVACYTITVWVSWTNDQTSNDDSIVLSICHALPVTGSRIWYLASDLCPNLEPLGGYFNSTTNHTCMDAVFGAGNWKADTMETVSADSIFSTASCLVFIDGSSEGETEFQTFVNENRSKMENWVASGGHLFLNCSNEGTDDLLFNIGFGNVNTIASYETSYAIPYDTLHPIFNGPNLPVLDEWSAFYFSFSALYGDGLTTLIADNDDEHYLSHELNIPVLAEKPWGNGRVIFGMLIPSQLVLPAATAMNCRENILAYLSQCNQATGSNSNAAENTETVTLFPDPTSEEVFVHFASYQGPISYSVSDMQGKKVLTERPFLLDKTELKIDVSDFAPGMYFLEINTGEKTVVKKLVVSR